MSGRLSDMMEFIEEFAEDFLSKIEKSVVNAALSNDKKLSEVYCKRTNCVNIIEHNGRYVCNQKCITIGENGKCIFSDMMDELKRKLPPVE